MFRRILKQLLGCSVMALGLAACQNYTSHPVCNKLNAVVPPGLTGTYSVSYQNEDYTTDTQEFTISADAKAAKLKMARFDGSSDEMGLCQVNGVFITESYDDVIGGYSQNQLYVTGMGLSFQPVFYDKAGLDRAGVPNSIITLPDGAKKVLGKRASFAVEKAATRVMAMFDAPLTGLMIDNQDVSSSQLMTFSKGSPIGITLLRK